MYFHQVLAWGRDALFVKDLHFLCDCKLHRDNIKIPFYMHMGGYFFGKVIKL